MSIQNSINQGILSTTALATGSAQIREQKAAKALQERRDELMTHKQDVKAYREFLDADDLSSIERYTGLTGKEGVEQSLKFSDGEKKGLELFIQQRTKYREANAGMSPEDLYEVRKSPEYIEKQRKWQEMLNKKSDKEELTKELL